MSVKDIDAKFERDLSSFSAASADGVVFHLGRPSSKVRSAGVADKEMKLYGSKVLKKLKKHGFGIDELHGLTKAVRNPIAVFNNYGKSGHYSILTSLKTRDGNFLVTLSSGKSEDANFNIVSSLFGKRHDSVVYWINHGYLRYVDKNKALDYLHLAAPIAAASDRKELSSAAKIVKSFRNNKLYGKSLVNG